MGGYFRANKVYFSFFIIFDKGIVDIIWFPTYPLPLNFNFPYGVYFLAVIGLGMKKLCILISLLIPIMVCSLLHVSFVILPVI